MGTIKFLLPCRWCGQSLREQALEGKCPQCRHEVGDTLDRRLIDAERMTVSGDALCAQCHYNVRTMAVSGVCPECAHPVADSLRPSILYLADTEWMARVRRGLSWLRTWLVSILITLLIALISPDSGFLLFMCISPFLFFVWAGGLYNVLSPDRPMIHGLKSDWKDGAVMILVYLLPLLFFGGCCLGLAGVILCFSGYIITSLFLLLRLYQWTRQAKSFDLARLLKIQVVVSLITWVSWVILFEKLMVSPSPFGNIPVEFYCLLFATLPSLILALVIFHRSKGTWDEAILQNEKAAEGDDVF